jgi:hypothetical protein
LCYSDAKRGGGIAPLLPPLGANLIDIGADSETGHLHQPDLDVAEIDRVRCSPPTTFQNLCNGRVVASRSHQTLGTQRIDSHSHVSTFERGWKR